MWNLDQVRKAAKESDSAYIEQPGDSDPQISFRWASKRGYLALELGPGFLQCALSTGSIQPRTPQQVLSILKPAVEAEVGHEVQENDKDFYLSWADNSGNEERITLGNATKDPQHAFWYVFDKTAPGVRELLGAALKSQVPSH